MSKYMESTNEGNGIERILWSIAFPGFGQFLNRQFAKGLLFVILEILINVKSNLNEAIILSFTGDTGMAIEQANYQWLMFYPCIYVFAIYDAYKNSGDSKNSYAFLPFVLSAYFGTVGVIYSSRFTIFGSLLGPIWLPIICFVLGASIGIAIIRYCIFK